MKTLNIRKSIWQQHLGPVKTEESGGVMPLDEEMIVALKRWRQQTPYARESEWIFASPRMNVRQPLWPVGLMRTYRSRRLAGRCHKHLNWHVFRHTFSTLLTANGEDMKTVQSLLRHANPPITMGIYTHAVNSKKRDAQSRLMEMVLRTGRRAPIAMAAGA